MDDRDFERASFSATIAFGILALAALVGASALRGDLGALVLALLACGASYAAQLLATHRRDVVAWGLTIVAALLWAAGLAVLAVSGAT